MKHSFPNRDVRLAYSSTEADSMVEYLEDHRVEDGGRYRPLVCIGEDDEDDPDRIGATVFSHPWSSPYLKAEATPMCGFRFNIRCARIEYVSVAPGFDLGTAWAELAIIEQAALGKTIYGRPRT